MEPEKPETGAGLRKHRPARAGISRGTPARGEGGSWRRPGPWQDRPVQRDGLRALFLDAGSVLVHPNWHRVAAALARHGVEVSFARLAAADPRARHSLDTPASVAAHDDRDRGLVYFERLVAGAGVALSEATGAALADLVEEHVRRNLWDLVPDDVPPALERLGRLGLPMSVVSNANGTVRDLLGDLGLLRHFRAVVDSAEEGVEKPDPRLFRIALERVGAEAASTLHVGDLYHVDVVGARAAGLRAALLDPAGLYRGADCPRFASLGELADHLGAGPDPHRRPRRGR